MSGLLILVGLLVGYAVVRPWHVRWGATPEEFNGTWPGDEIVPDAQTLSTRAITINATPEIVWPWLVQIGQGRGGFYSYDWLENLLGLDIHSADTILPEYQQLTIGDPISLGGPLMKVAYIEPERALVLRGADPTTGEFTTRQENVFSDSTWAFYLVPHDDTTTRLLIRGRGYAMPWGMRVANHIFEDMSFIMEQKMLRGIKQRVEANNASSSLNG